MSELEYSVIWEVFCVIVDNLFLDGCHEITARPEAITCNSLENQMVAMGKALIRAKKSMSLEERKLLTMALTKIKWAKADNDLCVELSKIEIAEIMKWQLDGSDRSTKVRKLANSLAEHSMIRIDGKDKDEWDDGFLITRINSRKRGSIFLYFGEQFRPLLENLTKDKDFVTIWANDIYGFNSIYAYLLFEDLRLHCDTRKTNWRTYTTKELKELFGIPEKGKGSYMRAKEKGGFNRPQFEKKVLDVAVTEINQGEMIQIQPFIGMEAKKDKPNTYNKLYAKIKKNGYVAGYQFKYVVKTKTERPLLEEL